MLWVYINGHGSDSLFLNPPPVELLSDYIVDNGLSGFCQKLIELAVYYRYPLLNLAITSFKDATVSKFFASHKIKPYFDLAPWLRVSSRFFKDNNLCHPLLMKLDSVSKGKFLHVASIFSTLASVNEDIRVLEQKVFYPFLSQPLIELALGIPSYRTFENFYDRYPVRKAISKAYHTNLVWRKDKGETSGVFQLGLKENLAEILEFCLEGRIIKQGLIDSNLLYANIKNIINGVIDFQWPLIYLICLEIYLYNWF